MMDYKQLYNPFIRIAGAKSLAIGMAGLLATSYLAYFTGTHFSGFLNLIASKDSPFWVYLLESGAHWIILSLLLYLASLLLSKSSVRAVDVFGTTLLSRLPLIVVPALRLIPYFESFVVYSTAMYLIIGVFLLSSVWVCILTYNAYRVSCNLRNEKLISSFAICLIVSEILIKALLHLTI